jgi:peptide/nickel transport system substrate-binding protein/oligopeptide transport system substrate-binding protein
MNDKGEMEAVPDLAEKWETTDSQTWTFTLKQGVMYQAPVSREVKAQDFVDSWNYVTDPANQSYVSYILAPIEGCDDGGYQVDTKAGLTGVTAVDDYTLQVKLRYAFAEFPQTLGHTVAAAWPVDYAKEIGAKEFSQKPVGTGPYVVESWVNNQSITLVKNPDYWDTSEGAGPYIDTINMPIITSSQTEWLEFQKGTLDYTSVPPGQVAAAEAKPEVTNGEWTAKRWPVLAVYFIGMNMTAYNPEEAKTMVDGMGGAPTLAYWYNTDEGHQKIAEVLQAGWQQAGIDVKLSNFEWGTFLDKLSKGNKGSGSQLFRMGWIADYPSMDNFLYPLFQSDQARTGSYTFYSNTQVDDLLLQARSTQDAQERYDLYAQAELQILTDMPASPLYFYRDFRVTNNRVANFVHNPMGFTDMWTLWIPEPAAAE